MNVRKQIKKNARNAMSGNWMKAVVILLLLAAVSLLFSYLEYLCYQIFQISPFVDLLSTPDFVLDDFINAAWPALAVTGGFAVISFLITAPFWSGVFRWFYRIAGGEHPPLSAAFDDYATGRRLGKSLWMGIQLGFRCLLWAVLTLLPVTVFQQLTLWYLPQIRENGIMPELYLFLRFLIGVLELLSWALLFYWLTRYFLCYYLLAEQPGMSVSDIIRKSVREMKERKGEICALAVTMIPWLLLCVLVFPAGFFFPYWMACCGMYGRIYLEEIKQREERSFTRVMEPASVPKEKTAGTLEQEMD